ncbi:MAG: Biotin/lipoate A/B protein ligase [Chaenotheca gracillima]|nr:MAG: Biotin/lipoate A/B protein ligase [Chaenotheca gracillima]
MSTTPSSLAKFSTAQPILRCDSQATTDGKIMSKEVAAEMMRRELYASRGLLKHNTVTSQTPPVVESEVKLSVKSKSVSFATSVDELDRKLLKIQNALSSNTNVAEQERELLSMLADAGISWENAWDYTHSTTLAEAWEKLSSQPGGLPFTFEEDMTIYETLFKNSEQQMEQSDQGSGISGSGDSRDRVQAKTDQKSEGSNGSGKKTPASTVGEASEASLDGRTNTESVGTGSTEPTTPKSKRRKHKKKKNKSSDTAAASGVDSSPRDITATEAAAIALTKSGTETLKMMRSITQGQSREPKTPENKTKTGCKHSAPSQWDTPPVPSEWPEHVKQAIEDYRLCMSDFELRSQKLLGVQYDVHRELAAYMPKSDHEWEIAKKGSLTCPTMLEYEEARRDMLAMDIMSSRAQDKIVDFLDETRPPTPPGVSPSPDTARRHKTFRSANRCAAHHAPPWNRKGASFAGLKKTCLPVAEILEDAQRYRDNCLTKGKNKTDGVKFDAKGWWDTLLGDKASQFSTQI